LAPADCMRRWKIRQPITLGLKLYNCPMANLTLVYGMRLLPADEVLEVGEAPVNLKNGRTAHVTMHVLEGSKEQIEKQLKTSLEAFFDFYPEI
jgi:hypothetical protein